MIVLIIGHNGLRRLGFSDAFIVGGEAPLEGFASFSSGGQPPG